MVKNDACHTFEPKYLLDYKVLKIPNDSTILFNGKERKKYINNGKPCSTTALAKNAWNLFLISIKTPEL